MSFLNLKALRQNSRIIHEPYLFLVSWAILYSVHPDLWLIVRACTSDTRTRTLTRTRGNSRNLSEIQGIEFRKCVDN